MAKKTDLQEAREQNLAEAVSKTEVFFRENSKLIIGCVAAVLVVALAILCYNRFYLQPKKTEAVNQLAQAERWFDAGEYELALNGDDNALGLVDIVSQYGAKAGEAVYLYAGVASLRTGAYEEAISYLKKYNVEDNILQARAQACIGDAYVELEDYATALTWFEKAAKTSDNLFSAAYLLKAGTAAEALGQQDKALACYQEIKDKWGNAPEAMEVDKYITRIQFAE
ncbi:MAG: hypothetical protein II171_01090 [Bacteroidales bacterium]|nr:hypothetical protein [Bacteroidales bacterium]MBQ1912136.1 hypothetical protein [Bacteroidales bacterium]